MSTSPQAAPAPSSDITLVVAIDAQRGIGVDNKLPWHLPEDLAHFKRVTLGRPIIMGRKTYESIGRPLPGRRNIVITRNRDWRADGVETAGSVHEAIGMLGGAPSCIICGVQVFAESMGLADRMIVTEIAHTFRCDTFFPEIDPAMWAETEREKHHSEAKGYDFDFVTYVRRR